MASRKSINIYVSKYFMAVITCKNISANCVTAGNLNARINLSSYLFNFLEGFCFRFESSKIQFEHTAVGMNSTRPEIKTPYRMVVKL